ncbi:aldose 1-epimerase family protein [Arthrobacter sp. YN]|uniref:aldose 1-epimerase family protein n=1 Tax=Arthrobacter sp. YN TaxID=2020486 RepID=UPI000B605178|nr:aldose 1-epimerase family protein [Arthrobacter sp. YN]ASN20101.1 aldose epimerase [Arthrobacter sp. YN]
MKIQLENDQLRAVIDTHGAELVSLQNRNRVELMWSGGPQWPHHAPLLFPIIGRLVDDVLHHAGSTYSMPKHGFAREMEFEVLESTPRSVGLLLNSNETTAAMFPFPFSLKTTWKIEGSSLNLAVALINTGQDPMPASIGWHPAFHWDPEPGWQLVFDQEESPTVRRVNSLAQLTAGSHPSPLQGRVLHLDEGICANGAVIFESVNSNAVQYISPHGPVLNMNFGKFQQFAVWTQPGADFICLEPWSGLPTPETFTDEIVRQPGQGLLQPGAKRTFNSRLTLLQ